ncbi:matrilin-4-like isoform X2 [Branchiostoma floridae x Branchiostoma japonicum]
MLWKVLLSAWLVSVAVCGANAQSLPNEVVPPNCDCDMDLMFLVDGSSSIGSEGFALAKEYIAHFIECYNCTNVGLIHCKCESNRSIPLCYYNNVPALVNAVEEIESCPRSTTRVGYCIYYSQCTTQWHAGFPSVVVVLADGRIYGTYNGRNTDDVAGYAENARNAGITVYAGAIGRSSLVNMN